MKTEKKMFGNVKQNVFLSCSKLISVFFERLQLLITNLKN